MPAQNNVQKRTMRHLLLFAAGLAIGSLGCEDSVLEGPAPGAGMSTGENGAAPGTGSGGGQVTDPSTGASGESGAGMAGSAGANGTGGESGALTGSGATTGGADLWCQARTVFRDACQTCHGSELVGGAPMSLVTYEDTQAPSVFDATKTVYEAVAARVHDAARPMPPVSHDPLSSDQLAALDAWIEAGAPNGACGTTDEENAAGNEQEFAWPEECEEFYEIRARDSGGQPHIVKANEEKTIDFEIPVPWAGQGSGPVQALAIKPIANNKRVVHHWILFHDGFNFITSWSPGKQPETFADDVGVYMPTEGTFRLNMHYYNVGNPNDEPDESGVEVCLTRKPRPKTATTKMFGPFLFSINGRGRTTIDQTCTYQGTQPVHLITSSPHMHSYGVHAKFEILRTDGSVQVLDDTPFNWEDQKISKVDAVLNQGDEVRTTCVYENNTGLPVFFGQSSTDEMCFNFARYYPMGAFDAGMLSCRPL